MTSVCWNPLEWRRGLRIVRVQTSLCRAMDSFWLEDWVCIGKLHERNTRVYTVDGEDIRSSGLVQVNDGLYAEVPLWCASGPIARRWIDLVCLEALRLQEWEWVLEDSHKKSCWKNSIGVSVPRPCGSDVYVCSKSCWLCLTVVCRLLECNKVPLWIEPLSTLQYYILKCTVKTSQFHSENATLITTCYWSTCSSSSFLA
jgi:hypothetical protein